MNVSRSMVSFCGATVCIAVLAQTPAQMEYERQQREYWRAQEAQRQEQFRQQQQMQDNARRQQEESARAARAATPSTAAPQLGAAPTGGGGGYGGDGGAAVRLEQARQAWLKKPPLAPQQNPLLGQWTRPMVRTTNQDPFAQLGALMKGGLCEVLFSGDAVFEFRPTGLVGIDKRTRRVEPLDDVQYRGDGRQVAVIPRQTLKLIVFNVEAPDRISWDGQNCTLTRVTAGENVVNGVRR
ncbi:MAG TPA: hypothetical protein VFU71_15745 [Burkholderiaceae bacterium]|nr:hypothetical protein [Burkholderiaceae bacterium]